MEYTKIFEFIIILILIFGISGLFVFLLNYLIENNIFTRNKRDYEIEVRTRKHIGLLLSVNAILLSHSKEASEIMRIIGWHMTHSEYGHYDINQVFKEWRENVK